MRNDSRDGGRYTEHRESREKGRLRRIGANVLPLMCECFSNTFTKARWLLKSYPSDLMDVHAVSTVVNSAKCIRPDSGDEIPSGRQLSLL